MTNWVSVPRKVSPRGKGLPLLTDGVHWAQAASFQGSWPTCAAVTGGKDEEPLFDFHLRETPRGRGFLGQGLEVPDPSEVMARK